MVTAEDVAGNISGKLTVTIVFDANLPVAVPLLDPQPLPTNEDTVTLSGSADAEAGIVVSGSPTAANDKVRFIVVDSAGNESEVTEVTVK